MRLDVNKPSQLLSVTQSPSPAVAPSRTGLIQACEVQMTPPFLETLGHSELQSVHLNRREERAHVASQH